MTTVGTLGGLVRYPVKSMQGQPLARGALLADGLEGDRVLAFRDTTTGRIASAKQPRPWRALLDCHASGGGGEVLVRLPDGRELPADDAEVAAAIERLTGRPVVAERAADDTLGSYDSTWPEVEGVSLVGALELPMALGTDAVRFVDVGALHLMTSATLDRLRALAPEADVEVARFRPNLVIHTPDADASFLEDDWVGRVLRIGETAEVRLSSRAPRCVMTTVEQPGLSHEPAVLRAAATNRHEFPGGGTLACAGAYAEVVTPGGIALGDPVVLR